MLASLGMLRMAEASRGLWEGNDVSSSQTRHPTSVLLTEGARQATEVKSAPTWPAGGIVSVSGGARRCLCHVLSEQLTKKN